VIEENLSIWSLIVNASLLVQGVMAILFIASVMSWVMIIQRGIYLRTAQRGFREFEDAFWSGVDLNSLYRDISQRAKEEGSADGIENVFRAGFENLIALPRLIKQIQMR